MGGKIDYYVVNYVNCYCVSLIGFKVWVIVIVNIWKESRWCGDGDRLGICMELKVEKLFNFY